MLVIRFRNPVHTVLFVNEQLIYVNKRRDILSISYSIELLSISSLTYLIVKIIILNDLTLFIMHTTEYFRPIRLLLRVLFKTASPVDQKKECLLTATGHNRWIYFQLVVSLPPHWRGTVYICRLLYNMGRLWQSQHPNTAIAKESHKKGCEERERDCLFMLVTCSQLD